VEVAGRLARARAVSSLVASVLAPLTVASLAVASSVASLVAQEESLVAPEEK
jgi:hypothetical protein